MACDCGDTCAKQGTDRIRDLEIALYRLETERTDAEERLKELKKEKARYIEEKYLAEKSPELSNAQKRADATDALIRDDPGARDLTDTRDALDIEIRCVQIDLSFERREFQRRYADALLAAAGLPPMGRRDEQTRLEQIERRMLEMENTYGRLFASQEHVFDDIDQRLRRLEPTQEGGE